MTTDALVRTAITKWLTLRAEEAGVTFDSSSAESDALVAALLLPFQASDARPMWLNCFHHGQAGPTDTSKLETLAPTGLDMALAVHMSSLLYAGFLPAAQFVLKQRHHSQPPRRQLQALRKCVALLDGPAHRWTLYLTHSPAPGSKVAPGQQDDALQVHKLMVMGRNQLLLSAVTPAVAHHMDEVDGRLLWRSVATH